MLVRSLVPPLLIASAVALLASLATAAQFTLEKQEDRVTVKLDGQPFTEYLTKNGPKPILWPIIGPGGTEMTRAYPMKTVEGEKQDHPHHRSLFFTHGNVNGIDFWSEIKEHGFIKHRDYVEVSSSGSTAVIATRNDWIDRQDKKHLEDLRRVTFSTARDARIIDFDITLTASNGPVVFGDTKEGTMGIRVPTVMDVDQKDKRPGGEIVNSEGLKDGAAWGKRARWVDYHGQVGGNLVGIAVLNHPSSFRYPTWWHVRTYGLYAANPFGLKDFDKANDTGEYKLPAGESIVLRYRFIFHPGNEKQADIEASFKRYAEEKK